MVCRLAGGVMYDSMDYRGRMSCVVLYLGFGSQVWCVAWNVDGTVLVLGLRVGRFCLIRALFCLGVWRVWFVVGGSRLIFKGMVFVDSLNGCCRSGFVTSPLDF